MAQALAEKLEHTGPFEKERVASVPQSEQLLEGPHEKAEIQRKALRRGKNLQSGIKTEAGAE